MKICDFMFHIVKNALKNPLVYTDVQIVGDILRLSTSSLSSISAALLLSLYSLVLKKCYFKISALLKIL